MHCHVHFSWIIFFYEDSKNVSDAERVEEDVIEMLTNNSTFICWNLISFDFFCLEMKKKSFKKTFMTCIVKADVWDMKKVYQINLILKAKIFFYASYTLLLVRID